MKTFLVKISEKIKALKKGTKWIILLCLSLILLLALIAILILLRPAPYLHKLPYDDVRETVYNDTLIVAQDGLWYLEKDGERSEKGFAYLKSVNDFYESQETEHLASRQLFDYYLAKETAQSNFLLLDGMGNEYRIAGDNFSLSQVALPFLIFTNNTNSRMAAVSLLSLQSELSDLSHSELVLTQSFPSLTVHKYEEDHELYDLIYAKSDAEGTGHTVYSASGQRILSGESIVTHIFEKENDDSVYYFVDEKTFSVYTAKGTRLSEGGEAPLLTENGAFGYQLCEVGKTINVPKAQEHFLLVFGANHHFTLGDMEYDLSTLRPFKDCLLIQKLHTDSITVIAPETKEITDYETVRTEDSLLIATRSGEEQYLYLGTDGRLLMRSPYEDLQRHILSGEDCTVLTGARYNAEQNGSLSYFFTSPDREAVRLDLPLSSSIAKADFPCEDGNDAPVYLISEQDQDGTALSRLYTPFSPNPMGTAYHAIDLYCHGGIVWALGTSYTGENYDILDPINNRVTLSIAAKSGDLARLTLELCDSSVLLSNHHDQSSGVPVQLLKLTRYDEKQSTVAATRYFALYRTASHETKNYQKASLHAKELGQNLLLSEPYTFYGTKDSLAIHSVSGTRIFRFDETYELTEYASIPYHVTAILSDELDSSVLYMKVSPITDGSGDLVEAASFGLTDSQGNLLLAPYYEQILHVSGNRFTVKLRNAWGVVERKNEKIKTLIDFRYAEIQPLPDGGYLAVEQDGSRDLYEGGKRLKKGTVPSAVTLTAVRTDDDGFLIYGTHLLLNIDGRLYLHKTEHFEEPICMTVSLPESHSGTLTDRRAKLISYYNEQGVLTEIDLLIPTVTDRKAFEEHHTGEWYASALAQNQTEPLTQEAILSSSEWFFHAYPKAASKQSSN